MNLNEDISRIKELMGVQTLNEQSDYMMDRRANALMNTTGVRSDKDYKGVEQVINKAQNPYEGQIAFLDKIPTKRIEKVALLFPQGVWYEELGAWFLNFYGIVSGWFRSLAEALGYVNKLAEKGVVTNQLVIGSHGSGGQLLITQKEGYFYYDNKFILDIKKIIDSKTTVFFTACQGANYLELLKDAADKLGVGAYGAMGVYNYISQSSERGFYWCSAKPIDQNLLQQEMFESKPLIFNGTKMRVNVPITTKNTNDYINKTFTMKFKNNSLFGIPMTDINFKVDGDFVGYNLLKKTYGGISYSFDIYVEFTVNFNENRKDKMGFGWWKEKVKKNQKKDLSNPTVWQELFESNLISIEINLPTGKVNVKNLKPFKMVESISNKFLIENKYCMKVAKPPINWIDEVLKKISPAYHLASKGYSWAKKKFGF